MVQEGNRYEEVIKILNARLALGGRKKNLFKKCDFPITAKLWMSN
jgi:hypothetical protein